MNRQIFPSALLVVLMMSSPGVTCPQTDRIGQARTGKEPLSQPHDFARILFRLEWGYLVIVEGSIGSVQNLHFLVDTGANPSIVEEKIAHTLGLADQPARVTLSRSSMRSRLVVLPSLIMGPVRAESLRVLAQDLSYFQKALGYRVDAIIGMDVLGKSSFTINYRTRKMLFGPIENFSFSAPFETETPLVTIRLQLPNRPLRLVVDTGGPDLMLFESRLPGANDFQPLGTERVMDASGTFQRRRVRIPKVYLAKVDIGSQIAFVVADQKDDGDYFEGVLGVRGPQFWKIAFDFEHRRFCWER